SRSDRTRAGCSRSLWGQVSRRALGGVRSRHEGDAEMATADKCHEQNHLRGKGRPWRDHVRRSCRDLTPDPPAARPDPTGGRVRKPRTCADCPDRVLVRPTLPSPARLAWLAAALLLLAPVPARAVDDVKADTWTVSDGLPQNTVTGLAQDERGYLWVATRKGLARFDGLEFQAAGIVDGIDLSTRRLTALVHDGAGLWIGTYGTGLFYLRDGRLKAIGPDERIPAEIGRASAREREA